MANLPMPGRQGPVRLSSRDRAAALGALADAVAGVDDPCAGAVATDLRNRAKDELDVELDLLRGAGSLSLNGSPATIDTAVRCAFAVADMLRAAALDPSAPLADVVLDLQAEFGNELALYVTLLRYETLRRDLQKLLAAAETNPGARA